MLDLIQSVPLGRIIIRPNGFLTASTSLLPIFIHQIQTDDPEN